MSISDRNLGKYKVPSIYIEEDDKSIIELPIQEVLINLVPGFSKKGPFNKPVKVSTPQEFEEIFGTLDKYLENKGSFFHRTVLTMLDQGPVWALNLLNTDLTRDKLKWKSISLSSQYDNGSLISSPYERFFNRQDFWERDDDSFNDIVVENNSGVEDDDRLFHITNMSDKTITSFMYKSNITGFDIPAEDWYNGQDKVPLFMNKKDWISDYMISVLVVNGDWSNYTELSSDSIWSTYFNENGLIKSKIEDFANHRLVTRLAFYDVSLIPNFKDLDNRDMFIKNVINNDTDKTGLFCSYNDSELLGSDYYKGKIDLIGQTLVGLDGDSVTVGTQPKTSIDFLSYETSISESITFDTKELNSSSNVFANYASDMRSVYMSGRTGDYTNWYTADIDYDTSSSTHTSLISCDGTTLTLSSTTSLSVDDIIYFNVDFGIIDKSTSYYVNYISGDDIKITTELDGPDLNGIVSGTTEDIAIYKVSYDFTSTSGYYNIGGSRYYLTGSTNAYINPFTISSTGATYSKYDVFYLNSDNTKINSLAGVQYVGTSPTKPNYILDNNNTIILGYGKTTYTAGVFTQEYTAVTVDTSGYKTLKNANLTNLSGTTSSLINYMDIIFNDTSGSSSDWTNYDKLRYLKIYNEISTNLVLGKGDIINLVTGYKFPIETVSSYDATLVDNARIRIYFDDTEQPYEYMSAISDGSTVTNRVILYYTDDEFDVGTGDIAEIVSYNSPVSTTNGIVGKYSSLYLSYFNGNINNGDYIWMNNDSGTTQKYWLKIYLDGDSNMILTFLDQLLPPNTTTISGFSTDYNNQLIVYSDKDNLKQTLEIENPGSITDLTNTTTIYVNKSRYSEVTKGSFLEAYYDISYYDSPGQGYINGEMPKKFVRIENVINDTVDTTLKIIYTDGPIKVSNNLTGGTDYYTTTYTSIDNYVTEYKGITITPFIVHSDSIPNGTEARQTTIMNAVEKGTRLYSGLINKNRISWRYLVDPFGLGLIANSKQQFVDLCGYKLNCLGFLNMPSARMFKKSTNPIFIDSDYSINMNYVKEGGDSSKNPDFYYSFGEGIGQSCVSYWFPYIKTDEESQKFIPPSAEIAKTYMNKFTSVNSNIKPWTILGGVIKGNLFNVKETEIRFTNEDLEPLHEMNSNPIDYVENYGYIINSDNSAQSYPYSSLSLIHTREVLIELENRLYDMLLNYHWRFNTPEIRSEIKFRADQICKELKESDALYNFKNVCDKTNNTDYIIGLQKGILDTYVEVIKGMGIIINQITILKKGTIDSSGFR